MKRFIAYILMVIAISLVSVAPQVSAQDATPAEGAIPDAASSLASLGLPTLEITVTADAYQGIPESIEAGRYLVNLTVADDAGEFGGGVGFVQPPADMTADEFLQNAFGPPPDESGAESAVASPMAVESEATPADEGAGGPPPFIFESRWAGGTVAGPGETVHFVVDLPPGEWIAWGDDPEAPQVPVVFTATGEMPTDLPEPEAGATLLMTEYDIQVSDGELVAGSQVVRVDNVGAQPHFVFAARGPDGMTEEQIGVALEEEMQAEMTGTPPAYSDLNPDVEISDEGFFTGTQSTGTSVWVEVDLEPGSYVLICFFPDLGDGTPHAYHGMFTVVEVPA